MIYPNVKINDIDMYDTYKMALRDRHCVQPPVPKTYFQDIPGADGSLDLSEAIAGRVVYDRRPITLNFGCGYPINKWSALFSDILKNFHGRMGKIIFDDDPAYYYIGRMTVSDYNRAAALGTFTIVVDADPYKYELTSGEEDWLWDDLDFETGIIREYGDLSVNGEYTLIIDGTEKWIIPEFIASADMTVVFLGHEYQIRAGTNKIYDIVIKEGENTLKLKGYGTVSVKYRGAML